VAATFRKRFGQRVKHLRQQRKLTQIELAEELGFSRSYLAEIETGRRNPSLETVKTISDGLGVSLAKLFDRL
jgi:transcriptional regulator with XRE-family HTH domain